MQYRKIAFVGAGNMAKAIIAGLVSHGYPADLITACAPSSNRRQALSEQFHIKNSADNVSAANWAEVVVLAVKPQLMSEVCQTLTSSIDFSTKLVLSIAAGIPLERFYQLLGNKLNIVRIMPNTAALIGQGMSGLYAPEQVNPEDRTFTESLMSAVGKVCWLKKESEINAIIAAAGSAPAYFFLFMEAMQQEAERLGFSTATARLLVQQSALGAAEMVAYNPQIAIRTLRAQVTSKGGTTAEAIKVFQAQGLAATVAEAMQAATHRAQEMEQQF